VLLEKINQINQNLFPSYRARPTRPDPLTHDPFTCAPIGPCVGGPFLPHPTSRATWGPCLNLHVFPQSRRAPALLQPTMHNANPVGIVSCQPNPDAACFPHPHSLPMCHFTCAPPFPRHSTTCAARVAPAHTPLAVVTSVPHTLPEQCAPEQASAPTIMPFEAAAHTHHSKAALAALRTPRWLTMRCPLSPHTGHPTRPTPTAI
jgi:hypothetical protein